MFVIENSGQRTNGQHRLLAEGVARGADPGDRLGRLARVPGAWRSQPAAGCFPA